MKMVTIKDYNNKVIQLKDQLKSLVAKRNRAKTQESRRKIMKEIYQIEKSIIELTK